MVESGPALLLAVDQYFAELVSLLEIEEASVKNDLRVGVCHAVFVQDDVVVLSASERSDWFVDVV